MDVKSHVISIDENGIANTTSIDRATPVLTKDLVTIKIKPSLDPFAQSLLLCSMG